MVRRGEILDSEDDCSDFGEGPVFDDGEAHDEREMMAEVPRDDTTIGASHNGTISTDPSFFQRIYDQQHAVGGTQDAIPDTAPADPALSTWTDVSSAPPPGLKSQTKDSSSLTFVTDPPSRRSKRTREVHQAEVIDLTDITTPRKEAASGTSDVWDVPTSSTRSQRTTRTYGKRKSAQLSLEQEATPNALPDTQDPYAFPDATPPTRGNKHGIPSSSAQQPPDSSPVMLIPTEEAVSSDRRTWSSRKKKSSFGVESSMPDTAAPSLYVTPSTLTASQKQEYRMVSSSEAVPEAPDTSLLDQSLGVGESYRSSAATTVAYPTPSRIGSSRRLPDVTEEMDEDDVATTSPGGGVDYQSSPDVLNDMAAATSASRPKRSRIKIVTSVGQTYPEPEPPRSTRRIKIVASAARTSPEPEAPTSTRRTKRRKVVRESEDDILDLDSLGDTQWSNGILHPETNDEGIPGDADYTAAQPEVDVNDQAPIPDIEPIDIEATEVPTTTPKPAAKGKRGRKKKAPKAAEPSPEIHEATPAETEPEPAAAPIETPEPPTKRRRGRPRKSEAPKTQVEPIDEQQPEQQPLEEAQAEALSELDHNSQPNSAAASAKENGVGDADRDSKENSPPAAKEVTAPGTDMKGGGEGKQAAGGKDAKAGAGAGASGAQAVRYRVGLSKRSRIAPLLKCLKKPV